MRTTVRGLQGGRGIYGDIPVGISHQHSPTILRSFIMSAAATGSTGAAIAAIEAAAAAENAINAATLAAKIATMGLKEAKNLVGQ